MTSVVVWIDCPVHVVINDRKCPTVKKDAGLSLLVYGTVINHTAEVQCQGPSISNSRSMKNVRYAGANPRIEAPAKSWEVRHRSSGMIPAILGPLRRLPFVVKAHRISSHPPRPQWRNDDDATNRSRGFLPRAHMRDEEHLGRRRPGGQQTAWHGRRAGAMACRGIFRRSNTAYIDIYFCARVLRSPVCRVKSFLWW